MLQRKIHHTFYTQYVFSAIVTVSDIIKKREAMSPQLLHFLTVYPATPALTHSLRCSTSQPTLHMVEQIGARSSTRGKLTWRVILRNMVRCTWNLLRCRISTAGGVFTKSCFVEFVHTILPSLPVQVNISPPVNILACMCSGCRRG